MAPYKLFDFLENSIALANNDPNTATLCKMAAKASECNFVWRYFTLLVIVPTINSAVVEVFFRNYQRGFSISTLDDLAPASYVTQFIIVGQNTLDVASILTQLMAMDYDTTGKYVIVCTSTQCDEKSTFELLSKYDIFNVLFFKNVDQTPEVFDYIPLIPGNCNNVEPRRLSHILLGCKNDDCFKKLLSLELSNMELCPFITAGFDQPPSMIVSGPNSPSGVDGETTKVLAEKLNATLRVKQPNVSKDEELNKWIPVIDDVLNGKADTLLFGRHMPLDSSDRRLLISYPYDMKHSVWVTAVAENRRAWEILLYPLQSKVWIAIVLLFVVIVFFSLCMKTFAWRKLMKFFRVEAMRANDSFVFNSFILFLGLPINRLSKKMTLRIVVCTWIWCTFLLRCSYTSSLLTVLKMRHYDDYLDTIREARYYGLKFGGHQIWKPYFVEEPDIYNSYVDLDIIAGTIESNKLMNGTSDFILAVDDLNFIYRFGKMTSVHTKLKNLEGSLVFMPLVFYYIKKFSVFMGTINSVLQRMIEYGFMQHHKDRFYASSYEKWFNHMHELQKDIAKPLTNSQLAGVYIIYGFGIFISVLVFIIEVIYSKFRK